MLLPGGKKSGAGELLVEWDRHNATNRNANTVARVKAVLLRDMPGQHLGIECHRQEFRPEETFVAADADVAGVVLATVLLPFHRLTRRQLSVILLLARFATLTAFSATCQLPKRAYLFLSSIIFDFSLR